MLEDSLLNDKMSIMEVLNPENFKGHDHGECPEDDYELTQVMREHFEWFGWIMQNEKIQKSIRPAWGVPTLQVVFRLLLKEDENADE